MSSLPTDKMYALRHGITGKIWEPAGSGGLWLFQSPGSLKKAWETAKDCGLVSSEFSDHAIITINLFEKNALSRKNT